MNDTLIEQLSDAVHQGWMAEKQAQGFADHAWATRSDYPGECAGRPHFLPPCLMPKHRHHDDMLPYAELSEHIKEYDRATVRAVLGALDGLGYQVKEVTPAQTTPPVATTMRGAGERGSRLRPASNDQREAPLG